MTECFPEPEAADETLGRPRESMAEYLHRTTRPGAAEIRRFINENLAALPSAVRAALCLALHRPDFWSSHLELVAARLFQLIGAKELEYEPTQETGRRLDFRVTFREQVIFADAVRPEWDRGLATQWATRQALIDIIERELPDGWRYMAHALPAIGPNESKQMWRRTLQRELARLPQPAAGATAAVHFEDGQGRRTELDLFAGGRLHGRAWQAGPFVSDYGDDEDRIGKALARKRSQARGADAPSVVVVGGGLGLADLDFDIHLFGRTVGRIDLAGREHPAGFDPSGFWGRSTNDTPQIAAAIVIPGHQYTSGGDPILYRHPRFAGILPAELDVLETRTLSADGIEVRPGSFRGLYERLNAAAAPQDAAIQS